MKLQKRAIKTIGLIMLCCVMLSPLHNAAAAVNVTGGFAGVSNYGKCSYGNRAGRQYVTNLSNGLAAIDTINYTESYKLTDNNVTVNAITNAAQATLFAYSGHGIVYNDISSNALHVNQPTSGSLTHSQLGEKSGAINKITTSTNFNHKYVILYTCNQLTNGGSTQKAANILKMCQGTRLICGFASTMYLDSREATLFADNMSTMTIIDAYNEAARVYQTQRADGDSVARVVGYEYAESDRISFSTLTPPGCNDNNIAQFDILSTVTIPHSGVII